MGVRELTWQHNNAGGVYVKYSPVAKFTGGSPAFGTLPTATDQQNIFGTATASMHGNGFPTTANVGTLKVQGACLGATGAFWIAGGTTGGASTTMFFALDVVSGDASQTDPCVLTFSATTSATTSAVLTQITASISQNSNHSAAFFDTALTTFSTCGMAVYNVASTTVAGTGLNVNPYSSKQDGLPIPYLRNAAQSGTTGMPGFSSLFRWVGTAATNFVTTFDSKNWICLQDLAAVWDQTTTPSQ